MSTFFYTPSVNTKKGLIVLLQDLNLEEDKLFWISKPSSWRYFAIYNKTHKYIKWTPTDPHHSPLNGSVCLYTGSFSRKYGENVRKYTCACSVEGVFLLWGPLKLRFHCQLFLIGFELMLLLHLGYHHFKDMLLEAKCPSSWAKSSYWET